MFSAFQSSRFVHFHCVTLSKAQPSCRAARKVVGDSQKASVLQLPPELAQFGFGVELQDSGASDWLQNPHN